MKELRDRFDKTYGWCEDCDFLVCKWKDCCLNREINTEETDCYIAAGMPSKPYPDKWIAP